MDNELTKSEKQLAIELEKAGVSYSAHFENPNHLFRPKNGKGELLYPDEKVVPNQALTPQDIIDRFTRGLPTEDQMGPKPVWVDNMDHDSPDFNQLANMDPMEKKDFARSARIKLKPEPPKEEPPAPPKTE